MKKPTGKLAFAYQSIANLEDKIQRLREENEALKLQVEVLRKKANDTLELREDNKALRDYVASLMSTIPKIKADAVREAAQLVMYEYEGDARNRDIAEYLEDYADKIERGE